MKEFFKSLITRFSWITLIICGLIFIGFDIGFNFLSLTIDCFSAGLTIIGLVLTIFIFFHGIARNTKFMENVFKYKKDKEFNALCLCVLVFSFISCICGMFKFEIVDKIAFYSLIIAIFELLGVTISMFLIIKYNNKSQGINNSN